MVKKKKRPLGITIIGSIEITKGVLGLAACLFVELFNYDLIFTSVVAAVCLIKIIIGSGLLNLKEIARRAMLGLMYAVILSVILGFCFVVWPWVFKIALIAGIILAIVFINYLTLPKVKQVFQ